MGITQNQVRPVDPVLSGLVLGAMPAAQNNLISRFIPQVTVDGAGSTGTIFKVHSPSFMGTAGVSLKRNPGDEMQEIAVDGPSTVTYATRLRSGKTPPLPVSTSQNSLLPGSLEGIYTAALAAALVLDEEADVCDLLFGSGTGWTNTLNWNAIVDGGLVKLNAPGSKAIEAIGALIDLFRAQAYGNDPKDVIFGREVARAFARHEQIQKLNSGTKFSDSTPVGYVTDERLKAIFASEFGLNLVIGGARRRTSNANQAFTSAEIAPDAFWMGILRGEAQAMGGMTVGVTPSAIAIIRKADIGIETEYFPSRKATVAYADMESIEKVLDVNMGLLALDLL